MFSPLGMCIEIHEWLQVVSYRARNETGRWDLEERRKNEYLKLATHFADLHASVAGLSGLLPGNKCWIWNTSGVSLKEKICVIFCRWGKRGRAGDSRFSATKLGVRQRD